MTNGAPRRFTGFTSGRTVLTPLPDAFFSEVLPAIGSLAELKLTLHVAWRLRHRRGTPRCLSFDELVNDALLLRGLRQRGDVRPAAEVVREALDLALARGTLLRLRVGQVELVFLNSAPSRAQVERLKASLPAEGPFSVEEPRVLASREQPAPWHKRPTIYQLYEQNIGLLVPAIAEELKEAERDYPLDWIEDAIREAVTYNKRNWRYVRAILERWAVEGRSAANGAHREAAQSDFDAEAFLRGPYGRFFRS